MSKGLVYWHTYYFSVYGKQRSTKSVSFLPSSFFPPLFLTFCCARKKMPRTAKNWQKPNANERRPPIYMLQHATHETRYTEANASNNTGSVVLAPHGALGFLSWKVHLYKVLFQFCRLDRAPSAWRTTFILEVQDMLTFFTSLGSAAQGLAF